MRSEPDMSHWSGRVDDGEGRDARRWHQVVRPYASETSRATVLLGFASDAGVRRNKGRPGAAEGPIALRRALGNLPWHGGDRLLRDAGDVRCDGDALEDAQQAYAQSLSDVVGAGHFAIGLGGGHEIAWATYQGLEQALRGDSRLARLGVLNFDAHLDMRPLDELGRGNSGTPFRQIATARSAAGLPFRYLCVGASRASNTVALLESARESGADVVFDTEVTGLKNAAAAAFIAAFVQESSALYLSLCLDVLPATVAPGVSAPAALGVATDQLLMLLRVALDACRADGAPPLLVADVAELAPPLDPDGRTARTAARLVFELAS